MFEDLLVLVGFIRFIFEGSLKAGQHKNVAFFPYRKESEAYSAQTGGGFSCMNISFPQMCVPQHLKKKKKKKGGGEKRRGKKSKRSSPLEENEEKVAPHPTPAPLRLPGGVNCK